jgi:hypothetical protein
MPRLTPTLLPLSLLLLAAAGCPEAGEWPDLTDATAGPADDPTADLSTGWATGGGGATSTTGDAPSPTSTTGGDPPAPDTTTTGVDPGTTTGEPPPPCETLTPPAKPPGTLPLTTQLKGWRSWYPMDRGQPRGVRWSNPWGSPQAMVGQYTWRYPTASFDPATNRPYKSMPASFGAAGFYDPHPVEYYMNINCNQDGACNMTHVYNEVISESANAAWLELWGAGGQGQYDAYLDDQALPGGCTLANVDEMMKQMVPDNDDSAKYRKPLAFGLPASPGTAVVGPVTCTGLLANYTTPIAAFLQFVVTENQKQETDPDGWAIVHARNIYYVERDVAEPLGRCNVAADQDVELIVEVPGACARQATFCVQNYELYAMREVPEAHRGWNGFGSFKLSTSPGCLDVNTCQDFTATAYNTLWQDQSLAPAYYEPCTLGENGFTCS